MGEQAASNTATGESPREFKSPALRHRELTQTVTRPAWRAVRAARHRVRLPNSLLEWCHTMRLDRPHGADGKVWTKPPTQGLRKLVLRLAGNSPFLHARFVQWLRQDSFTVQKRDRYPYRVLPRSLHLDGVAFVYWRSSN